MSGRTMLRRARRTAVASAIAVAVAASFSGCAEIEVPSVEPYEPAALETPGPGQPARITLTDEAERRVALQTTLVRASGGDVAVDYPALVYDKAGKPWVFAVVGPRTYMRAPVEIKEVTDAEVILSSGPPAGTQVVTTGSIELWGAELGIAGKH
jgi:hypothetical protein